MSTSRTTRNQNWQTQKPVSAIRQTRTNRLAHRKATIELLVEKPYEPKLRNGAATFSDQTWKLSKASHLVQSLFRLSTDGTHTRHG